MTILYAIMRNIWSLREAVIPFLGYLVLQMCVVIIGLNVVREKEPGISEVLESWVMGQMLMFAILQILAVPMILMRLDFNVLYWTYAGICAVLFGSGLWRVRKVKFRKPDYKSLTVFAVIILIIAAVLIIWQSGTYFFQMHLDEDDARWLAEANDALQYGNMLIRDFDTGNYLGYIQEVKDMTSPWPMMLAVVSRFLHTRPAVFAHTIYASVEVILMYAVYWLTGTELFKKPDSRAIFILCSAVIHFYFAFAGYTQTEFAVKRIWQGKATVAGVIIPLLIYLFLIINRSRTPGEMETAGEISMDKEITGAWLKLPIVCCAACLMSGMGISLSGIMIAVYGTYHIIAYRDWKRIPLLMLALSPTIIFLLVYSMFRPLV